MYFFLSVDRVTINDLTSSHLTSPQHLSTSAAASHLEKRRVAFPLPQPMANQMRPALWKASLGGGHDSHRRKALHPQWPCGGGAQGGVGREIMQEQHEARLRKQLSLSLLFFYFLGLHHLHQKNIPQMDGWANFWLLAAG